MNVNGGASRPLFARMELPGFHTTWAGPNPLGAGFCFGSEEGALLFTDVQGHPLPYPTLRCHSGEAINGVARAGEWIAVSTREDVTVVNVVNKKRNAVVLPQGAHGMAAAPGGYFVAPLGRAGIMLMKPGPDDNHPVAGLGSERNDRYYYRVVATKGAQGKDILACACRPSGIGITEMVWGQPSYNMSVATFDGLDVVDVCVVNPDGKSPAVAAVGRDGTLILVRDSLHDMKPLTIKFNSVKGVVYRLLSSGEHLFVLTSQGLYGLMKLGGRLVHGMPPGEFITQVLATPMEAVDANTVDGKWLLVVLPDEIRRFDLAAMEEGTPEDLQGGEMRGMAAEMLDRTWKFSDGAEQSMALVSGS